MRVAADTARVARASHRSARAHAIAVAVAGAIALGFTEQHTVIAVLAAVVMHWLVLNDVHLNPYDRATYAPYGQDTNPWLFEQSVEAMRKSVPDASVVIVGGDLLAHRFPALARDAHADPYRAGLETTSTIAHALARAFPHAQFLFAVGNNDDPCGDYRSETGGPYLRDVASVLEPLVNHAGASPGFKASYERGGYYSASLPGGMRAVVLNSVLWSFVYRGSCQSRSRAPGEAEMAWLRPLLQQGDNVVVMHMPPGFDPESTTVAHRVLAVPFLASRYDDELRSLFVHDRSHVAFALAGHTHRYDFRAPGGVPMLLASSLSPVYRNAPAFYRLDVDGDELHDVVPYTFDRWSGEWTQQTSFDAMFGTRSFSRADLVALSDRLTDDPALRARWIEAYDVWSSRIADITRRWQTFRCAQVAVGAAYGSCAGTTRRSFAFVAGAAGVAVIIIVALVFALRGRSTKAS